MKKYICPAGHYCGARYSYPTPCPAKYYYTGVGATSSSACIACPANHECTSGSKYPQPCGGGRTCSTTNMYYTSTVTCANGRYAGNDSPSTAANCNACWQGHYCPSASVIQHTFPIRCPKGTWSTSTSIWAASQCITSPAGVV
jgi:hypothetical protein